MRPFKAFVFHAKILFKRPNKNWFVQLKNRLRFRLVNDIVVLVVTLCRKSKLIHKRANVL